MTGVHFCLDAETNQRNQGLYNFLTPFFDEIAKLKKLANMVVVSFLTFSITMVMSTY